jgi:hypothetical protein
MMPIKKLAGIVVIFGVFGAALLWIKGASQTDGRDVQTVSASAKVPAPGPGQNKVVLKNLGMA